MADMLLVFGLGYSGAAIAQGASGSGMRVIVTSRTPGRVPPPPGVEVVGFEQAGAVLDVATHVVQTAAPEAAGDPALLRFAGRGAPRWVGVLSTTGVYGDRGGDWVDEDTAPAPTGPRGMRRLAAERAWVAAYPGAAVDLFRLAGIYGPGRSVLEDVRAGRARRVDAPGHSFGRIHRDDIAGAVLAAMLRPGGVGARVLNLSDDLPAPNMDVVAEAARLLGAPLPPLVGLAEALAGMSEMGRSFWAENRKVASRKTQEVLGRPWRHPTYREGLASVLAEEGSQVGANGVASR